MTKTIKTDNTDGHLNGTHTGKLNGWEFESGDGRVKFEFADYGIRGTMAAAVVVTGQSAEIYFE